MSVSESWMMSPPTSFLLPLHWAPYKPMRPSMDFPPKKGSTATISLVQPGRVAQYASCKPPPNLSPSSCYWRNYFPARAPPRCKPPWRAQCQRMNSTHSCSTRLVCSPTWEIIKGLGTQSSSQELKEWVVHYCFFLHKLQCLSYNFANMYFRTSLRLSYRPAYSPKRTLTWCLDYGAPVPLPCTHSNPRRSSWD